MTANKSCKFGVGSGEWGGGGGEGRGYGGWGEGDVGGLDRPDKSK